MQQDSQADEDDLEKASTGDSAETIVDEDGESMKDMDVAMQRYSQDSESHA